MRKLIFVLFFALTATLACSKDDKEKKQIVEPPGAEDASCIYSLSEGDSARTDELNRPVKATTTFEKKYYSNYLDGVLAASMAASIDFIKQTSVQLFQAPSHGGACSPLNILTVMPSDVSSHWASLTKTDSKSTGYVMGLYLPKGTPSLSSLTNEAAIILRSDSNRWTLVHEFMHHNFMTYARDEEGYDDVDLRHQLKVLPQEYKRIVKDPDLDADSKRKQQIKIYLQYAQDVDQYYVHYYLEEIAVESLLRQQYDQGNLKFVPVQSYNNAAWYIAKSQAIPKKDYEAILNDIATFRQNTWAPQFADEDKNLAALSEKINNRLHEIDTVVNQNRGRHNVNQLVIRSASHADATPTECSHMRDAEKIRESFQDILGHAN